MPDNRSRRRLAGVASAGLLAGALTFAVAPPVHAAPVFVDADTTMDTDSSISQTGVCVLANVLSPPVTGPVAENGPATSQASSGTSIGTNAGNPDASIATSGTGTASVKSAGGHPTSIDFASSGSAAIDVVGPTSACSYSAYTQHDFTFHFTVTQPGILHLNLKASKGGYTYLALNQVDPATTDDPYYSHYGTGSRFTGTDDIYLPAGDWYGEFYGETYVSGNADKAVTSTSEIHATFSLAGSQTKPVTGKGKKYVTLPAVRSCTTHTVDTAITGKKKRAQSIKQVTYFVNDVKVKKVKHPHKKAAVKLAVADDQAAEVVAEVKLLPARKGRPGKTYEVSASYEACS
jgi:hypothetical protein